MNIQDFKHCLLPRIAANKKTDFPRRGFSMRECKHKFIIHRDMQTRAERLQTKGVPGIQALKPKNRIPLARIGMRIALCFDDMDTSKRIGPYDVAAIFFFIITKQQAERAGFLDFGDADSEDKIFQRRLINQFAQVPIGASIDD